MCSSRGYRHTIFLGVAFLTKINYFEELVTKSIINGLAIKNITQIRAVVLIIKKK